MTPRGTTATGETAVKISVYVSRGPWVEGFSRLLRHKSALVGLIIVGILLFTALVAPLIAPYDPITIDLPNRLQAPSSEHLFGTDAHGRDILSRIIYGTRISILVGIIAVGISLVFGTFLAPFRVISAVNLIWW